jgi:hypothetical protein
MTEPALSSIELGEDVLAAGTRSAEPNPFARFDGLRCGTRRPAASVEDAPTSIDTATRWPQTLIPFHKREALTLRRAAEIAGKSESTVRAWCDRHHISRRIAGGARSVSQVALTMLLEGDHDALAAYHDGARAQHELVARYYRRLGLDELVAGDSCCLQFPREATETGKTVGASVDCGPRTSILISP